MHINTILLLIATLFFVAVLGIAAQSTTDSCGTHDGNSVTCTAATCVYCSVSGSGSSFACRKTRSACPSCKGSWNSETECQTHLDPSSTGGESCSWCSVRGDAEGCCGPRDQECNTAFCTTEEEVKFGAGVIAGIAIGSAVALILIILLIYCCCCKKSDVETKSHH